MVQPSYINPALRKSPLLQPAIAWIPILALVVLTALCVAAGLGGLLNLLFPAGAFVVAIVLYWRYPVIYVSFAWWLWLITPWVRRMADFNGSGWTDPSPILLTPLLVSFVSGFALIKGQVRLANALPFLLCAISVAYGLLVGLVINEPQAAVLAFINWISPIFLGFHLFSQWRSYPLYRQTLQRSFAWGALVMGIYGVVQFLMAPPWDAAWMADAFTYAGLNSIGQPEPLAIRVFSLSYAPQPFATLMMAGLLLLLAGNSQIKLFAAGFGIISFLLSLARAAWIGLFVSLVIFLPSLKSSVQIRLIGSLLILSLLMVPIVQMEPFASTILPRIEGLTNTSNDVSASDRSEGYQRLAGKAFSDVSGRGLGFVFEDETIGVRDSGLLTLWFSLGWLGAVPYLLGLGLLLFSLFQTVASRFDLFASAARAIAVGTFIQIGLNEITVGVVGAVLWTFLGVGMAARQYHTYQQRLESLGELGASGMSISQDLEQYFMRKGG